MYFQRNNNNYNINSLLDHTNISSILSVMMGGGNVRGQ